MCCRYRRLSAAGPAPMACRKTEWIDRLLCGEQQRHADEPFVVAGCSANRLCRPQYFEQPEIESSRCQLLTRRREPRQNAWEIHFKIRRCMSEAGPQQMDRIHESQWTAYFLGLFRIRRGCGSCL